MTTLSLWPTQPGRQIKLWDWQEEAIQSLRDNFRRGVMRQVLVSPTGSGKTILSAYMIEGSRRKFKRAGFVVDRSVLVTQTSKVFDAFGITHGVFLHGHERYDPAAPVQILSAQTMSRGRVKWPDFDLLVVDECHTMYRGVTEHLRNRTKPTIGLTATPFTRGLGQVFDGVVNVRSMNDLVREGLLVPFDTFAPSEPDMTGAKVVGGEWTDREAERRALPIIGDCVAEYIRHAYGKKFIAFGVTIRHCEEMVQQFVRAGIPVAAYTSDRRTGRSPAVEAFMDRDSPLMGLVTVNALSKGFDAPGVEALIFCRPLRNSFTEHLQALGRGLRKDPDNPGKRCLVLDHAGNMRRFWQRMQDFFQYGAVELDDGVRKPAAAQPRPRSPEPMFCPSCAMVHKPRPTCPGCGYAYPRRRTVSVQHKAGTLSPITGLPSGSREDRQRVYSELLGYAALKNRNPGWAAHVYRERFGEWPNGLDRVSTEPTPELRRWLQQRAIRRSMAEAKRKAAAAVKGVAGA